MNITSSIQRRLVDINSVTPDLLGKLRQVLDKKSPLTLTRSRRKTTDYAVDPVECPDCKAHLGVENDKYLKLGVCDFCNHTFVLDAPRRLKSLADPDTIKFLGQPLQAKDILNFKDSETYTSRLEKARARTGLDDSIMTAVCRIEGVSVVVAVLDFNFMGGSMGSVLGEKIAGAFEYASRHHLPVVTVANSGGARMQEGLFSLMQMAKTAAAVERFRSHHLFYISVLASPTTGGVYASFASLGDLILAEPQALIGFAGPRVVEQTTGDKLPPGSHKAEFLLAHGQLDAIIERSDQREFIGHTLKLVTSSNHNEGNSESKSHTPSSKITHVKDHTVPEQDVQNAWDQVLLARHPDRPTTLDYLKRLCPDFIELKGDLVYGDDRAIITGIGEIAGNKVVLIGQERGHITGENGQAHRGGRVRPEGYRKAIRMMNLAAQLGWPLVTFVDTPGADPGIESEERGLASSLAHCLARLSTLPVPVVSIVIGEGGSGGAIALALADKVLMLENSIYSVIAPEGAAAILYRDAQKAPEVASLLKLSARNCLELGLVDGLIPEPEGGAQLDPDKAAEEVQIHLHSVLAEIKKTSTRRRLDRRYQKFRRMGQFEVRSTRDGKIHNQE